MHYGHVLPRFAHFNYFFYVQYFFEWMCWISIVIMALPSATDLIAQDDQPLSAKIGVILVLFYVPRLFYDCLVYWTGAAPAESRSIQRRPNYKEYQRVTNVFLPLNVPFFNHHRTTGWPSTSATRTGNGSSKDAEKLT